MTTTPWRKSTRSGGSGSCVETRQHDGRHEVRDTKNRDGGTLSFSPAAWGALIADIKAGGLDGPAA